MRTCRNFLHVFYVGKPYEKTAKLLNLAVFRIF